MLLTDFFFLNSVNANLSNSPFLTFSLIFYELYIIAFEEKKNQGQVCFCSSPLKEAILFYEHLNFFTIV